MKGKIATTDVYRDQFGVLTEDAGRHTLELRWTEGSAAMTDDDFRAWLERYAAEAEARRPANLLIDVRQFRHRPGAEVGLWRDQHIIPRYNKAGVRKFAFLLPPGSAGTVAAGNKAQAEPPGTFPTAYFDDRAQIDHWFNS
jgi:hypothetical protein